MTPIFLAVPLNPRVGASLRRRSRVRELFALGQRRAPPGRNSEWKAAEQKQRVRANGCGVYLNVCVCKPMQTYKQSCRSAASACTGCCERCSGHAQLDSCSKTPAKTSGGLLVFFSCPSAVQHPTGPVRCPRDQNRVCFCFTARMSLRKALGNLYVSDAWERRHVRGPAGMLIHRTSALGGPLKRAARG